MPSISAVAEPVHDRSIFGEVGPLFGSAHEVRSESRMVERFRSLRFCFGCTLGCTPFGGLAQSGCYHRRPASADFLILRNRFSGQRDKDTITDKGLALPSTCNACMAYECPARFFIPASGVAPFRGEFAVPTILASTGLPNRRGDFRPCLQSLRWSALAERFPTP